MANRFVSGEQQGNRFIADVPGLPGNRFLRPQVQVDAPEQVGHRATELTLQDYGNAAMNTGPGELVRAAGRFPGALVDSAVSTAQLPSRVASGARALLPGGEGYTQGLRERVQGLMQPVAPPPQINLGGRPVPALTPPSQDYSAGFEAAMTPEAQQVMQQKIKEDAAQQVQGELLTPAEEAKSTLGASVLRDAAFTGLTALSPPLGLAAGTAFPAALESLSPAKPPEPDYFPRKPEAPVSGPADAAIRTLLSPEFFSGLAQSAILAAPMAAPRAAMKPPSPMMPGTFPIIEALPERAIQKSIKRNLAPEMDVSPLPAAPEVPRGAELRQPQGSYVKDALSKLVGKEVREGFTPKKDLMVERLTKELLEAPESPFTPEQAAEYATKIRSTFDSYQEMKNFGRVNAQAVAEDLAANFTHAEKQRVGQLMEKLPKGALPENQLGPLNSTDALQQRFARYYEDALGKAKTTGTAPKLAEASARLNAWQRISEDLARLDPKAIFNYTLTAAERAPVSRRVQDLQSSPELMLNQASGARDAGIVEFQRTKSKVQELSKLIKRQGEPGQVEKVEAYKKAKAELEAMQPKLELEGQPSLRQQELEGQRLTDIRKVLTAGGLTSKALREDKIARLRDSVPADPELVQPAKNQVDAFAKYRPKPMETEIKEVGEGAAPEPLVPKEQGKGQRTVFVEPGQAPAYGRRPAILPEPAPATGDKRLVGTGPIRKLNDMERAELDIQAKQVRKSLEALQATKRDIQRAAKINYLEKQIQANKLLSEPEYQDVKRAHKAALQKLERSADAAKELDVLTKELQRNYSADKGYMKHVPVEKLVATVSQVKDDILSSIQPTRPRQDMRLREEGYAQRQRTSADEAALMDRIREAQRQGDKAEESRLRQKLMVRSPTEPTRIAMLQNFDAAAFKDMADALLETPHVINTPTSAAAVESLGQAGWKRLPDSDVYGQLRGKVVSPTLAEALQELRSVTEPVELEKNLNYMASRMAGNKAAKSLAANFSNTAGIAMQAFMDAGVPLREIPDMFRKGVNAMNDPRLGNELRAQGLMSMLGSVDSRKQLLALEKELGPVVEAMTGKEAANNDFFAHKLWRVIDTGAVMMKHLMTPIVGKTGANVFDHEAMGKMFRNTEAIARAGLYVKLRESGMNPRQAADRVKQSLVDYSNKSPLAESLEKYPGGLGNRFAHFQIAMADRALTLATNRDPLVAARFWSVPLAVAALNKAQEQLHKDEDLDRLKKANPTDSLAQLEKRWAAEQDQNERVQYPWQKGANSLLRLHAARDENGNWQDMSFSRLMPYGGVFDIATGVQNIATGENASMLLSKFGSLAMPVQPVVEMLADKNFYYDQPLSPDSEIAPWYDPMNIRARFLEHAGNAYLPEQFPGGRHSNTLARIRRGEGNPDAATARGNRLTEPQLGMNAATGIRMTTLDPDLRKKQVADQYGDRALKSKVRRLVTDRSMSQPEKVSMAARVAGKYAPEKIRHYFPKEKE